MKPHNKLYLVVRSDLPPGQQAVQPAHALREFMEQYPDIDREWYRTSNYLILKAVEDEITLRKLAEKAKSRGIRISAFHEPDRGNEMTALAIEPNGKSLVQKLPLALAGVA